MVIFYHYFVRYSGSGFSIYPPGVNLDGFVLFQYGYYGVHLFFAISGFVIMLTLNRSSSITEFAVRRLARLWPTMLICTFITYAVCTIYPQFWPQSAENFIPSLTFISPQVWNRVVQGLNSNWVDGAYWSLFVEVRFYALAVLIFFSDKNNYARNFSLISFVVCAGHVVLQLMGQVYWADLIQLAFIAKYLPWFLVGIAGAEAHQGNEAAAWKIGLLALSLTGLLVFSGEKAIDLLIVCTFILVFICSIRFPRWAHIFSPSWLTHIGVISYSLYLLHQYAGLTLVYKLAKQLNLEGFTAIVSYSIVLLALLIVSQVIFRFWESPLNGWFVSMYRRIGRLLAG